LLIDLECLLYKTVSNALVLLSIQNLYELELPQGAPRKRKMLTLTFSLDFTELDRL